MAVFYLGNTVFTILRNLSEIELELGLVLETLKEELVLLQSETKNIRKCSVNTHAYSRLSLRKIIVNIRTPEPESSFGNEDESFIRILNFE